MTTQSPHFKLIGRSYSLYKLLGHFIVKKIIRASFPANFQLFSRCNMLPRTTILVKNIVSICMMAALLLLVSGNYWVYGIQKAKMAVLGATSTGDEESGDAPDAPNPTEEKTSGGLQTISEYLHEHAHFIHHPIVTVSKGYGHEFDQLPVQHPEQHTPPPKQG